MIKSPQKIMYQVKDILINGNLTFDKCQDNVDCLVLNYLVVLALINIQQITFTGTNQVSLGEGF